MGKRFERFGEVRIIDETNGIEFDFIEKTEWILEHHPRCGSCTVKKVEYGTREETTN